MKEDESIATCNHSGRQRFVAECPTSFLVKQFLVLSHKYHRVSLPLVLAPEKPFSWAQIAILLSEMNAITYSNYV